MNRINEELESRDLKSVGTKDLFALRSGLRLELLQATSAIRADTGQRKRVIESISLDDEEPVFERVDI